MPSDNEKFRPAVRELLETANAGRPIESILIKLDPYLRNRIATFLHGRVPKHDRDDVIQEILFKLRRKPPSSIPEPGRELSIISGWLNTCVNNYLIDIYRNASSKISRDSISIEPDPGNENKRRMEIPDPSAIHPDGALEARQKIEKFKIYLENKNPLYLQYFELLLKDPDTKGKELADKLGIKRNHLDKIAQRVRHEWFVRFPEDYSSDSSEGEEI